MIRQSRKAFSMLVIFMTFMFTIGQSFVPMIANAQELNTTGFVDSFTIDKTTLNYGEQTRINVNFSDKSGNQMKTGDTLTLTLPPELVGFSGTIPLENEAGTNFGTCQITTTNVVCTFTDTVEKLRNIRGQFYFTVRATNVATDQKKDVETSLGTNLDKQTVTITGPTSGGSGSKPFFYKAGDIQPDKADQVRWFLNINLNKEYLSRDIVVSDRLQEGQTLNKDSFRITVDNRESLSIEEFQKQRYGVIQFNDDGLSFKVVINWNMGSARSFTVYYTSTITESGKSQEFLKNNYELDYQILYKDPVSESDSATVKNITFGGDAQGDLPPKGTLRIVKHIEGNKEKVIPNVSFKLYKESGEQIGDTYTTDDQGMVEAPALDVGNYYVQEIAAPDYLDFDPQAKVSFTIDASAEKGVKLMIPNKVKTTSISGTKTWNDNNATERPSTIQVELLQNGQVIKTQDLTATNDWKYTFTDVPAYDADGNAYTYTVKEQPVAGYISEVNGYDITNTKVVQTTTVEGTKTWKDDNAADRPSAIRVDLLQNDTVIQTQDVTASNGWKYTFANLAVNDADGKAYTYTVKEQPVAGYTSEVHGYDITNTKVMQTTTVEGTKTWKDDNAADRPSSIKVDLLQNNQVIQTQDVTASNGWKYTFDKLAAYDADGKAYTYSVKEQPVAGYTSEVHGYDITNTKVKDPVVPPTDGGTPTNPGGSTTDPVNPPSVVKTKVAGTKTWKDDNTTDRPSSIKVDLLQNGTVIRTQEVTAANGWRYTFTDVAANDANGKAYIYKVKEQPVDGYTSEVHGYDITNTKVKDPVNPLPPIPGGSTTVEGTKTWKGDKTSDRPSMIIVDLLQNGTVILTQEVTAANGWNYTFAELATYDDDGNEYLYEVKEQPVAGYKSEVHGYDITNTKIKNSKPTDTTKDGSTPSKGDDKVESLLPKTGESSAGVILEVVGMLLLILGVMLFVRYRTQQKM
ncbi:Cna B-type domain-containing protein [Paenibacillus sp. GCM10027629]|uniref:Cna B-type domain-containing protein n=1 Tax=Paenibacillus sp. GCM10027629 TaxID=3273414 RepID=UPI00362720F3